jgi:hypothetical protein
VTARWRGQLEHSCGTSHEHENDKDRLHGRYEEVPVQCYVVQYSVQMDQQNRQQATVDAAASPVLLADADHVLCSKPYLTGSITARLKFETDVLRMDPWLSAVASSACVLDGCWMEQSNAVMIP